MACLAAAATVALWDERDVRRGVKEERRAPEAEEEEGPSRQRAGEIPGSRTWERESVAGEGRCSKGYINHDVRHFEQTNEGQVMKYR